MMSSHKTRVFGVAAACLAALLCLAVAWPQEDPSVTDGTQEIRLEWTADNGVAALPYVEEVTSQRQGKVLDVTIGGNVPDPGYTKKPVEARLFGRLIVLFPRVQRGEGMAIQVLAPFQATCQIQLPDEEAYTLCVVGRTGVKVKEIPAPKQP